MRLTREHDGRNYSSILEIYQSKEMGREYLRQNKIVKFGVIKSSWKNKVWEVWELTKDIVGFPIAGFTTHKEAVELARKLSYDFDFPYTDFY